jgi:hypothetical protein
MKMENTRFRVGDEVMLQSWMNMGWYERHRNCIVRVVNVFDGGVVCEQPIGWINPYRVIHLIHAKSALIKRFIENYV